MVQLLRRAGAVVLAVGLLLLPAAHAFTLRSGRASLSALANASQPTAAEIKDKWAKMDDFMEIMFTIACKWKHGKDVHGMAAEQAKGGSMDANQVRAFKSDLQKKNVDQLSQACGMVVAKGEGPCRQSCADRWGEARTQRASCDEKCRAAYANFEKSCVSKAKNLEIVYATKVKMADARLRCHEGNCADFPTVWAMADATAMQAEVDSRCASRCTEDQIQVRCGRIFQLKVDFLRANITAACHDASTVMSCFKQKEAATSTAYDSCRSTNNNTCVTQYTDCQTQGHTSETFQQAEEFCVQRKKMCLEQVTAQCLAEHRAALQKDKEDCEKDAAAGLQLCEEQTLAATQAQEMTQCKAAMGPVCSQDCHNKCNTTAMNTCLADLSSSYDPAEDFCRDFWRLLHDSTQTDPMTGDPIVLLSQRKP